MRRLAPHLAPLGYSPRRYAPLSPAPVLGMGERLTDLRDIQQMFANGEQGGYWPADPAYAYEDSAGTTLASVDGVVGYRADVACGKHAIQATTANKPYLRRTPATGKYWYDSNTTTGTLTATFSGSLGSSCTIATVTPEGVSVLENQTVGSTYNICPPFGYNANVLIINRALTAAEKALVTRVMQRSLPTLGSELVTNGSFDNGTTGWLNRPSYPYGAFTVANGIAQVTGNNADTLGGIFQLFHVGNVVGRQYLLKGSLRSISGANTSIRVSNAMGLNKSPSFTNSSTSFVKFTCAVYSTESSGGFGVTAYPNAISGVAEFDDISCWEIL